MGSIVQRDSIQFGIFELDLKSQELRKSWKLVKLPNQSFRVLAMLASRPGELVTREEIQQAIWGGETFVDFEQGLNHCIKHIRAALDDDPQDPRFVETKRRLRREVLSRQPACPCLRRSVSFTTSDAI